MYIWIDVHCFEIRRWNPTTLLGTVFKLKYKNVVPLSDNMSTTLKSKCTWKQFIYICSGDLFSMSLVFKLVKYTIIGLVNGVLHNHIIKHLSSLIYSYTYIYSRKYSFSLLACPYVGPKGSWLQPRLFLSLRQTITYGFHPPVKPYINRIWQ